MITVFTATYNRRYLISNLYYSLKRQTSNNFEWIIVDDGSTDDTESLVQKWKEQEKFFPIKYVRVPNGGKHRAINIGVKMASTEAFFIVDSDDYLVKNAIEYIEKWFREIFKDSIYAGVSGLKGYSQENPIGGWGSFSGEYVDATNLERAMFGLSQDKAEIYKTSILKKYPFPEFEDEKFITEGIVWDKIAQDGYKIRWYKKVIYICKYLEDGLTRYGYMRSVENPKGYMAYLNLLTEIYGKEYVSKYLFGFYFVLRSADKDRLDCKAKMQCSLQTINQLEEKYKWMISEMQAYFSKNNFVNIAIYGLGNVGHAFCASIKNLNIHIKFAIDVREVECLEFPVYSPEDEFPQVDAVVITLKNYNQQIETFLKKLFCNVIYWKDISKKYWID